MASHRGSKEEKIIDYFRTAELAKVEVVYNLVKSAVKERLAKSTPARVKGPRKPRAPKTSPAPAAAAPAEGTQSKRRVTARSVAAASAPTEAIYHVAPPEQAT